MLRTWGSGGVAEGGEGKERLKVLMGDMRRRHAVG